MPPTTRQQIGGADGMAKLLEAPLFKEGLNVGIALDEGIANPGGWWMGVLWGVCAHKPNQGVVKIKRNIY